MHEHGVDFLILADSREQNPYTFRHVTAPVLSYQVKRVALPSGDYAAADPSGGPDFGGCTIERKTLPDLYASVTHGRERFQAECERLAELPYPALVIEADWSDIARPNTVLTHPTRASSRAVIATLIAWSQRFGVHIFPCPGRQFAEQCTYRILERWVRDRIKQVREVAA